MEENADKRGQGIALALVLAAVVLAVGGYIYLSGKSKAPGPGPTGQTPPAAQGAHPGDLGGGCPVSQIGGLLGVEIFRGHAPASTGSGAGIQAVNPEGVGAKAGLQSGDVVVSAGRTRTTCPRDLLMALSRVWPKEKITLAVERKGKALQIEIPAQPIPPPSGIAEPPQSK